MVVSLVFRYVLSNDVSDYCTRLILTAACLFACNAESVEPIDLAYITDAIRIIDLDDHDAANMCNNIAVVMDTVKNTSLRMMCSDMIAYYETKSAIHKASFEKLIEDLKVETAVRKENQRKLAGKNGFFLNAGTGVSAVDMVRANLQMIQKETK